MKSRLILLCVVLACALPMPASAGGGIVVIVNKANDNDIDAALVSKIYRGDARSWAKGGPIVAYDLPEDNLLREDFDGTYVGKSEKALLALWSQNVLTGKASPPKTAASDGEVRKAVASNKGAIGYIQASSVDDSVKVALH